MPLNSATIRNVTKAFQAIGKVFRELKEAWHDLEWLRFTSPQAVQAAVFRRIGQRRPGVLLDDINCLFLENLPQGKRLVSVHFRQGRVSGKWDRFTEYDVEGLATTRIAFEQMIGELIYRAERNAEELE